MEQKKQESLNDDRSFTSSYTTEVRKSSRKRKPVKETMTDFSESVTDSDDYIPVKRAPPSTRSHSRGPKPSTSSKKDPFQMFSDLLETFGQRKELKAKSKRKPLCTYTDEELARQDRELTIEERRARIAQLNAQTDYYKAKEELAKVQEEFYARRLPSTMEDLQECARIFIAREARSDAMNDNSQAMVNGHVSASNSILEPEVEINDQPSVIVNNV